MCRTLVVLLKGPEERKSRCGWNECKLPVVQGQRSEEVLMSHICEHLRQDCAARNHCMPSEAEMWFDRSGVSGAVTRSEFCCFAKL